MDLNAHCRPYKMTVLQILIFVSNMLGSYRNYLLFSKFLKRLVVIRIISEMVATVTIDLMNIIRIYIRTGSSINADSYISYITEMFMILKTVSVVFGSVAHSDYYKLYYENFQIIYSRCKNDPSYVKCEKRLKIQCVMCMGILIIILLLLLIVEIQKSVIKYVWLFVIEKAHYILIESRFMAELMLAYCIISYINEFLRILNNSVRSVMQHYEGPVRVQIFAGQQEACQISEIVNTWRELYQHNLACAEYISKCFCSLVRIRLFILR